jgi:hypothetical protein
MKIQLADILDRMSIVMLYKIHGAGHVVEEYTALLEEIARDYKLLADFIQLLSANSEVWKLESDIRKGKEGEMTLEEIGRRALQIRDHNKCRVYIKDQIAQSDGGFRHIKHDHASA